MEFCLEVPETNSFTIIRLQILMHAIQNTIYIVNYYSLQASVMVKEQLVGIKRKPI